MSSARKTKLFDEASSDEGEESDIKINTNYAERYNEWREAEIKRKLEDRYGNLNEELSSSSSDDDEDPQELEKALSKDFFEVISQLRKKDPKIYNPEVRFFSEEHEPKAKQVKKEKEKPLYLRDYERKLILERGGALSDEDSNLDEQERVISPTLAEKEKALKESLQRIVHSDSDNEDGLLKKKVKTDAEKKKEEEDYIEWLCGRKQELEDKSLQESLSTLKDEWSNPNLDEGEKFLRDYVLNKRYLDPEDDEVDASNITDEDYQDEYMDEFERKYNFRFEEPDSEFLKRYPRTIENSVRRKDNRRKLHRDEVKKRKEEEKLRQREELKLLKSLKRKEIVSKIEKLKQITGNAELGISDKDLEGDYDPEEHDRKMRELFSDDYYEEGNDEAQLDELDLPPLEEDIADDYEDWDEYDGVQSEERMDSELHCEDPNFNMDCDYNPATARAQKDARPQCSKERRKLKRQSRFGTLVRKKKPKFDPNEKSFQQYLDEYYGIDYEDIVGGMPCRFKYRSVMPNSFGLTIEEILAADDKELNAWVSIKKAAAIRPDHVELNEKKMYELKAQNEALKRKILPSLYKQQVENDGENSDQSKKKSKKFEERTAPEVYANSVNETGTVSSSGKKKKTKSLWQDNQKEVAPENAVEEGDAEAPSNTLLTSKTKKKKRRSNSEEASFSNINNAVQTSEEEPKKKPQKRDTTKANVNSQQEITVGANCTTGNKRKLTENADASQKVKKRKKLKDSIEDEPVEEYLHYHGSPKKLKKTANDGKQKVLINGDGQFLQNAEPVERKKRARRGKQRRKLKLMQKLADSGPRDIKAENKARAIRKQKYTPAPVLDEISDSRLKAYGIHPKKFKNKLVYG